MYYLNHEYLQQSKLVEKTGSESEKKSLGSPTLYHSMSKSSLHICNYYKYVEFLFQVFIFKIRYGRNARNVE